MVLSDGLEYKRVDDRVRQFNVLGHSSRQLSLLQQRAITPSGWCLRRIMCLFRSGGSRLEEEGGLRHLGVAAALPAV